MKKRVFVIAESKKDHRFERLKEEVEKRKDVEIYCISSYEIMMTSEGVFFDGKKMNLKQSDFCWFLSNSATNFFIANKMHSFGFSNMWPNIDSLIFSDKFLTANFFQENNVATPKTALLTYRNLDDIRSFLGDYPLVIKKNIGSVGRDVEIVRSDEDIKVFIDGIYERLLSNRFHASRVAFILQEFIKESSGSDYRVLVLGGKILGTIKRTAQNGDFKANISLGGKAESMETPQELLEISKKIIKEGNLFYAGIDFVKSDKGYLALEINTSAQFKGFEEATGINVAEKLVNELLENKLK